MPSAALVTSTVGRGDPAQGLTPAGAAPAPAPNWEGTKGLSPLSPGPRAAPGWPEPLAGSCPTAWSLVPQWGHDPTLGGQMCDDEGAACAWFSVPSLPQSLTPSKTPIAAALLISVSADRR